MLPKISNLIPIVYGAILFSSRPVLSDDFSFDTCDFAVGRLQQEYSVPVTHALVDVRFSYKKKGDECEFFQQARVLKDDKDHNLNECTNGSAIGCSADSPPQIERWMEVITDPDMKRMDSVIIWHCKGAKEFKEESIPKSCKLARDDNPDVIERCCGAPREYNLGKNGKLLVKDTNKPYLDANGKEVYINNDWPNFAKHSFYSLYNNEVSRNDKAPCTAKSANCRKNY